MSSIKAPLVVCAAVLLLSGAVYFGADYYRGTRLVRELCIKDGGFRVYRKLSVDGFLDETAAKPTDCYECFERLIKKQFKYIDVHVKGDPATSHPLAIRPGYYRLSVSERGDPRCESWAKNVNAMDWGQQQHFLGLSEAQCIAVDALPARPDEAMFRHVVRAVNVADGPNVTDDLWEIVNAESGQRMASIREFLFYSKWTSALSEGPVNPTSRCMTSEVKFDALRNLLPIALRSEQAPH